MANKYLKQIIPQPNAPFNMDADQAIQDSVRICFRRQLPPLSEDRAAVQIRLIITRDML